MFIYLIIKAKGHTGHLHCSKIYTCVVKTFTLNYKLLYHTFPYFIYKSHFFSARIVNIWHNLPNSVVNVSTVNVFEARLDNFGCIKLSNLTLYHRSECYRKPICGSYIKS